MSDRPDDPDDTLAAEYVLGALDAEEMRAVAARRDVDPALARDIAEWERRLLPLAATVEPVALPPDLWRRLEASLGPAAGNVVPLRPRRERRVWRSVGLWRATTAGALAIAASLAAVVVLRGPEPPRFIAALAQTGAPAPVFIAQAQPDGSVLVRAVGPVQVAAGKDLELWALPAGAQRPVSLGVLPAAGKTARLASPPAPGTQLLVSLEPQGGSPTGQPTGPVLFGGTLTRID